ncbi:MAG TPA: hypothetical protein VFR24_09800 [Candidatus Angelobacter sp.]|nr:hypothetical protein [Candidatus Angelobacter sp.]
MFIIDKIKQLCLMLLFARFEANSIRGEEESKKIPSEQRCKSSVARSSGDASAGEAGREQEAQSKRETQTWVAQMAGGR